MRPGMWFARGDLHATLEITGPRIVKTRTASSDSHLRRNQISLAAIAIRKILDKDDLPALHQLKKTAGFWCIALKVSGFRSSWKHWVYLKGCHTIKQINLAHLYLRRCSTSCTSTSNKFVRTTNHNTPAYQTGQARIFFSKSKIRRNPSVISTSVYIYLISC